MSVPNAKNKSFKVIVTINDPNKRQLCSMLSLYTCTSCTHRMCAVILHDNINSSTLYPRHITPTADSPHAVMAGQ